MGAGEFERPPAHNPSRHLSSELARSRTRWHGKLCVGYMSGLGLGVRQYALPGKPASHGCVSMGRLQQGQTKCSTPGH
jgi:hypothetical protein